jgi:hypothetical protein
LFREVKKFIIFIRAPKSNTAVLAFLTLLLAVAGLSQAVIYELQLTPLRKSADTAAKELEVSERPWLSIENVTLDSPLIFDENGVEITIRFNIKNSGKTPAIRSFWMGWMFPQDLLMSNTLSERKQNCRGILYQSSAVHDSQLAETWFPGTSAPVSEKVRIIPSAIAKAMDVSKEMFSHIPGRLPDYANGIYPVWAFCIAYRSSLSDVQYHTAYLFQIFRKDGKPIFPIPKGEIPSDELTLSPHPMYAVNTDD